MAKKKTTSAMDYDSGPFAAPKSVIERALELPASKKLKEMQQNSGAGQAMPITTPTTTPKATAYTPVVQPSRTTDNIKADIASVVGSGNIDYNKLTSLAGELGGGKEAADYIDSLISGKSTQSNVDKEYTYNVPFESAPPPTNEVYTMEPDTFDPQQYIRALMEAQSQQQTAVLDKVRKNSLDNLAEEEAGLPQQYYDARNRVGAQKDVGDLNFAQYMASRGIQGSAGGANQMYSNSAFQGQIGALDRQEQATRDRIARNRTGIENAYHSDVAAAKAGVEAQGLQAFINQMNADRMFGLQEAGVTGKYQGSLTPSGQQTQQELLRNQAATLAAANYDNIAGYINTLDPNDPLIPYLNAERQKKIQTEAEQAAAAAAAASEAEQQQYKQAFDLWVKLGYVPNQQVASVLGVDVGARTADFNIDSINAQTSRQNAQTARTNAKTAANKTEINDVPIKVKDYYNRIIDMKDAKLKDADGVERRRYDDISIRDYVLGLPLNDDEIAYLLSAAGISNIIGPAQYGQ